MSFSVHFGFLGVWIFSCALSLSVPHSEKSTLVGNEGYEVGESSGCCQTDLAAGGMVLGFRQQNGGSSSSKERDDAGGLLERYLYGHDLVARESSTGLRSFYSYDGHGSVRGVTSSNGLVEEEFDYDAFGVLLGAREWDDVSGQMEGVTKPLSDGYFYSGERWDSDLGMYYLRARYLNAGSGRFHTMDDYEGRRGEPVTLHKYLYGNGNPVGNVDPSGRFSLANVGTAIGVTAKFAYVGGLTGFALGYLDGLAESWDSGASVEEAIALGFKRGGQSGAIGAAMGAVMAIPGAPQIVIPIATAFGVPLGVTSSIVAYQEGKPTLGTYRAVTAVLSTILGYQGIKPGGVGNPITPKIPTYSNSNAQLSALGTLKGKGAAQIDSLLATEGFTSITGNNGGKIYTKALLDGNTVAVRVDPAMVRNIPKGFADEVAHIHKELVPTSKVQNGNYRPRDATSLDDAGQPSSDRRLTHIPLD